MARKPVHLTATGPRGDRQAMWEHIRRLRVFTPKALRGEMPGGAPKSRVSDYLRGLTAAGYLSCTDGRYQLENDCGVHAPRVTRDGQEVTQGRGTEKMWRHLRICREVDARELAGETTSDEAPVTVDTARTYLSYLHKAGYLTVAQPANRSGGLTRYRLLKSRYTGPRPPMIQRVKQVFDPNLKRVVWPKEAGDE